MPSFECQEHPITRGQSFVDVLGAVSARHKGRSARLPRQQDALLTEKSGKPTVGIAIRNLEALVIDHGISCEIDGENRPHTVDRHRPRVFFSQLQEPIDQLLGSFFETFVDGIVFENREDRFRGRQGHRVGCQHGVGRIDRGRWLAEGDHSDRETSTEGRTVHRHVRSYARKLGRTTTPDTKAGNPFVQDEKHTGCPARIGDLRQDPFGRRHDPEPPHQRIDDQRRHLRAATGDRGDDFLDVPSFDFADRVRRIDRQPGRRTDPERRSTVEDNEMLLPGGLARPMEHILKSIVLAAAEPPTGHPGQEMAEGLGELHLVRHVKTFRNTALEHPANRVEDELVGIPDDRGAAGADVIDVADVVDVVDARPPRLLRDQRLAVAGTQHRNGGRSFHQFIVLPSHRVQKSFSLVVAVTPKKEASTFFRAEDLSVFVDRTVQAKGAVADAARPHVIFGHLDPAQRALLHLFDGIHRHDDQYNVTTVPWRQTTELRRPTFV